MGGGLWGVVGGWGEVGGGVGGVGGVLGGGGAVAAMCLLGVLRVRTGRFRGVLRGHSRGVRGCFGGVLTVFYCAC